MSSKTSVPIWILIMGGVGIVLGLATYGARACAHCRAVLGCHHPATHRKPPLAARHLHSGYKIMRVLGVKMTKLTNSRGETRIIASASAALCSAHSSFLTWTTGMLLQATAWSWLPLSSSLSAAATVCPCPQPTAW